MEGVYYVYFGKIQRPLLALQVANVRNVLLASFFFKFISVSIYRYSAICFSFLLGEFGDSEQRIFSKLFIKNVKKLPTAVKEFSGIALTVDRKNILFNFWSERKFDLLI